MIKIKRLWAAKIDTGLNLKFCQIHSRCYFTWVGMNHHVGTVWYKKVQKCQFSETKFIRHIKSHGSRRRYFVKIQIRPVSWILNFFDTWLIFRAEISKKLNGSNFGPSQDFIHMPSRGSICFDNFGLCQEPSCLIFHISLRQNPMGTRYKPILST